jgi:hypothetical protein
MTAISNSYITTDTIFETWMGVDPRASAIVLKAADVTVQSWYLQRATKAIDSLPLRGRKYMRDGSQDRQFPREYMTEYGWYPDADESGNVEVPQAVLDACCEEAIAIYDILNTADRLERLKLQREGITSVSYGGTSEQYSTNPGGSISGAASRYKGLMSKEAYDLVSKYILRSAPIV